MASARQVAYGLVSNSHSFWPLGFRLLGFLRQGEAISGVDQLRNLGLGTYGIAVKRL